MICIWPSRTPTSTNLSSGSSVFASRHTALRKPSLGPSTSPSTEAMDPSKRYLHTRELSTMGATGVSRARSRRLSFQHHFELVVRSAQAEGKVIPGDPGILVRMMTTTVLSGVWYNPDGTMSPDDFRALLRRIVLRGLLFTEPRPASTS